MTANDRKMAENPEKLTIIAGFVQILCLEVEEKIVKTPQNIIQ